MVVHHKHSKYFLVCTSCGRKYSENTHIYYCKYCSGKLDVKINLDIIDTDINHLKSRHPADYSTVEKYFDFLPLLKKSDIITLGEGYTKLVKSKRVAELLNVKNLYLKDETTNPTGSFKDRPVVVGANKAIEFGAKVLCSATSGNAGISLAAWCAKANINCIIFVSTDISSEKLIQLAVYNPIIIKVRKPESYNGDITYFMLEQLCASEKRIHPVPTFGTLNPYQIEGVKTIAYEICEALSPLSPTHVILPVGGGGLLLGNIKGFSEYKQLGFISSIPKIHAIQPAGCAPFVKAYKKNTSIKMWPKVNTVAMGLADPYTWDGNFCLKLLRENNGSAETVSDAEIIDAQRILAKYEGIFAEPSGATALAGLMKLLKSGEIDRKDIIVCEITGSGFKDLKTARSIVSSVPTVQPTVNAVKRYLKNRL
jgi:threonine synthase